MTTRGEAPSVQAEMAKFSGFTTNNGETVTLETPENLNPMAVDVTEEELVQQAATKVAEEVAKKAVKAEKLAAEASESAEKTESTPKSEEDDAAEPEDEPEDDDSKMISLAEAKKLAGKRINERTRELKQAERERDAERRRNDTLEQRLAALEKGGLTEQPNKPTVGTDELPKPADFEYGELDAAYIRALARYETRQELKAERTTQQEEQQRRAAAQQASEFTQAKDALVTAGAKKYEDFDDVVLGNTYSEDNPAGWPLSETLGNLILTSETGPDVAYYLATHIKEARQIYGKSPIEQAAYFGRLEAKLSSSSDATTPAPKPVVKTTKAPDPIYSARGIGGNNSVDGATSDFTKFEAMAMQRRTN